MSKMMSILIVDDHPAMRTTLKDILEVEDYKVYTAKSGLEGIEICKTNEFDLILMDVRMPDLNGVESFRQIKAISGNIRVIMMSGLNLYLSLKKITPTSVTIMFAETDRDFLNQAEEAVHQNAYTFVEKPGG